MIGYQTFSADPKTLMNATYAKSHKFSNKLLNRFHVSGVSGSLEKDTKVKHHDEVVARQLAKIKQKMAEDDAAELDRAIQDDADKLAALQAELEEVRRQRRLKEERNVARELARRKFIAATLIQNRLVAKMRAFKPVAAAVIIDCLKRTAARRALRVAGWAAGVIGRFAKRITNRMHTMKNRLLALITGSRNYVNEVVSIGLARVTHAKAAAHQIVTSSLSQMKRKVILDIMRERAREKVEAALAANASVKGKKRKGSSGAQQSARGTARYNVPGSARDGGIGSARDGGIGSARDGGIGSARGAPMSLKSAQNSFDFYDLDMESPSKHSSFSTPSKSSSISSKASGSPKRGNSLTPSRHSSTKLNDKSLSQVLSVVTTPAKVVPMNVISPKPQSVTSPVPATAAQSPPVLAAISPAPATASRRPSNDHISPSVPVKLSSPAAPGSESTPKLSLGGGGGMFSLNLGNLKALEAERAEKERKEKEQAALKKFLTSALEKQIQKDLDMIEEAENGDKFDTGLEKMKKANPIKEKETTEEYEFRIYGMHRKRLAEMEEEVELRRKLLAEKKIKDLQEQVKKEEEEKQLRQLKLQKKTHFMTNLRIQQKLKAQIALKAREDQEKLKKIQQDQLDREQKERQLMRAQDAIEENWEQERLRKELAIREARIKAYREEKEREERLERERTIEKRPRVPKQDAKLMEALLIKKKMEQEQEEQRVLAEMKAAELRKAELMEKERKAVKIRIAQKAEVERREREVEEAKKELHLQQQKMVQLNAFKAVMNLGKPTPETQSANNKKGKMLHSQSESTLDVDLAPVLTRAITEMALRGEGRDEVLFGDPVTHAESPDDKSKTIDFTSSSGVKKDVSVTSSNMPHGGGGSGGKVATFLKMVENARVQPNEPAIFAPDESSAGVKIDFSGRSYLRPAINKNAAPQVHSMSDAVDSGPEVFRRFGLKSQDPEPVSHLSNTTNNTSVLQKVPPAAKITPSLLFHLPSPALVNNKALFPPLDPFIKKKVVAPAMPKPKSREPAAVPLKPALKQPAKEVLSSATKALPEVKPQPFNTFNTVNPMSMSTTTLDQYINAPDSVTLPPPDKKFIKKFSGISMHSDDDESVHTFDSSSDDGVLESELDKECMMLQQRIMAKINAASVK